MIEFRLQIDSRITRSVYPLIEKCFVEAGKVSLPQFPHVGENDQELIDTWEESLKNDLIKDRQPLARLLKEEKFKHGYIEVPEEEVDCLLRSLTELRLYVRQFCLKSFSDEELEQGAISFSSKPEISQSYYLAYLVMAQVQEGLLEHLSGNLS